MGKVWMRVGGRWAPSGRREEGRRRPACKDRGEKIGVARAVVDRGHGTGRRLDRGRLIYISQISLLGQKKKQVSIMQATIDDQLVSSVQLELL